MSATFDAFASCRRAGLDLADRIDSLLMEHRTHRYYLSAEETLAPVAARIREWERQLIADSVPPGWVAERLPQTVDSGNRLLAQWQAYLTDTPYRD